MRLFCGEDQLMLWTQFQPLSPHPKSTQSPCCLACTDSSHVICFWSPRRLPSRTRNPYSYGAYSLAGLVAMFATGRNKQCRRGLVGDAANFVRVSRPSPPFTGGSHGTEHNSVSRAFRCPNVRPKYEGFDKIFANVFRARFATSTTRLCRQCGLKTPRKDPPPDKSLRACEGFKKNLVFRRAPRRSI